MNEQFSHLLNCISIEMAHSRRCRSQCVLLWRQFCSFFEGFHFFLFKKKWKSKQMWQKNSKNVFKEAHISFCNVCYVPFHKNSNLEYGSKTHSSQFPHLKNYSHRSVTGQRRTHIKLHPEKKNLFECKYCTKCYCFSLLI